MNIIYTCPKCGSDLRDVMITTNPPINKKECFNCGWSVEEETQQIRIPYPERKDNVVDLGGGFSVWANDAVTSIPAPCKDCKNHPSNGGSGICHCTLGSQTFYY